MKERKKDATFLTAWYHSNHGSQMISQALQV